MQAPGSSADVVGPIALEIALRTVSVTGGLVLMPGLTRAKGPLRNRGSDARVGTESPTGIVKVASIGATRVGSAVHEGRLRHAHGVMARACCAVGAAS